MSTQSNQTPPNRGLRGVGCLIVALIGMAAVSIFGVAATGLLGGGMSSSGQITETVEHLEPSAAKKIVQIDIRGVLMDDGGPGLGRGVAQTAIRMLRHSLKDARLLAFFSLSIRLVAPSPRRTSFTI